jgi:polysaccharide biosynthesis transport protein
MDSYNIDLEQQNPRGQGFRLDDVYYIIFKHKWKIIIGAFAGLFAAECLHKFNPPPYQSEAKLYVRYVMTESKSAGPAAEDVSMKSPDQRGETIMDSEVEILTSLDLARQVAAAVGPERILGKKEKGDRDLDFAAAAIKNNLTVEVPPMSSVIRVTFKNRNREVAQVALRELVDRYLKMHGEIYQSIGKAGDFLSQETDQLRSRLSETEEELRKAKDKVGVISLEETKKADSEAIAKIRQEIFGVEAEMAERTAILNEMSRLQPSIPKPTLNAEIPSGTDRDRYREIAIRVDLLQKKEQGLLTQYTPENSEVKAVQAQLAEAQGIKEKLERDNPAIVAAAPEVANAVQSNDPFNAETETVRLAALQARVKVLNAQLENIRAEMVKVDEMDSVISELQRRKDIEEGNYKYYVASLEQSRIDEALGGGRVSNISQIQVPSSPYIDWAKAYKLLGLVGASGLFLGLGSAFFVEFYLDRSVRRPVDFERGLVPPLMLAIPDFGKKAMKSGSAQGKSGMELGTADSVAEFRPYLDTMCNLIISDFEARKIKHNPKLIAVTGVGEHSGVTTIAAGLAACLSKTGNGKILLVNMSPTNGSAQRFYRGKAVRGLEDVLSSKDSTQIEDKLYVVSDETDEAKPYRAMPQRFNELVPKLKAADFDYIIFDMPAVSQTSITPRLAGFMDMVMLVVKSENTDRDIVNKAAALLGKATPHVGAVLNMTHSYVPARLQQQFFDGG